jgi:hypothetical protein
LTPAIQEQECEKSSLISAEARMEPFSTSSAATFAMPRHLTVDVKQAALFH